MKSLLVTLLLFTFTQTSYAAFSLDQVASKKVYNALAAFGLRWDEPTLLRTDEWAKPVKCLKEVEDGVHYLCLVHDQFRNVNVTKSGAAANKLYELVSIYKGTTCGLDGRCSTFAPDIKCIHNWKRKGSPQPETYYSCLFE